MQTQPLVSSPGVEGAQGNGDELVVRQEQVMLDHYYEDFEATETASIAFDNRSTLGSTTVTVEGMNSNVGGNDGAHEVRTQGAQGGTSFELPMTEQDFRVLTQKVSKLVLIMIVLLNTHCTMT